MRNKCVLPLALIFLIGVALRIYNLGFQCSWMEEDYTATISQMPFTQIWTVTTSTDFTPPLFYWLEHFIGLVIGYSYLAMRILPAIFGIMCIPAMYYLGREFKDEIAGLFCAGSVAALYPMVYYSQFARAYTLSFLFFILMLAYYIKILKSDHRPGTLVTFGILAALCIWSHAFSLIPISFILLDLLLRFRLSKESGYTFAPLALGLIPLVGMPFVLLKDRVIQTMKLPFGLNSTELLVILPNEFFNVLYPFFWLLTIAGLVYERNPFTRSVSFKLAGIAVLTVIVALVISSITPMYARYFLHVSFIFILVSAGAVSGILSKVTQKQWVKIAVVILVMILFLILQNADFIAYYTVQKYVC